MVFGKPLLRPDDALESPYIKVYEFVFVRTQALAAHDQAQGVRRSATTRD